MFSKGVATLVFPRFEHLRPNVIETETARTRESEMRDAIGRFIMIAAVVILASPIWALQSDDHDEGTLIGTWKLVAAVSEEIPSGTTTDVYGANPTGYLNYAPDGRMIALIVRGDRKKPVGTIATPREAEALFRSMLSYTGTYLVRGNQVIHHVDASWNEAWTATNQTRLFTIERNRLILSTEPSPDPFTGKMSIRRLIWDKL
jgi:hypothetical protein